MARSIPALVNPTMLIWAREEAGYSTAHVAKKIKIPIERFLSWENGSGQPTLSQAEELSKLYHRSFSVFCLPSPPKTVPLASEYRRLPGVIIGSESPELRIAIREMTYRRRVAFHLLEEQNQSPDSFLLKAFLNDKPEHLASDLRRKLGVTVEQQLKWRDEFQGWHIWRESVESQGVLTFQFYNVNHEEIRGISILEFPLPVIGINNREISASKPFTLLHELIHIMLANAKEEMPALKENRSESEWARLENFSESVAGAVLMPKESLLNDPLIRNRPDNQDWNIKDVSTLAKRYKVTPSAAITRLLLLNKCTPFSYKKWQQEWETYLSKNPPKRGGGIATPAEKALNKNGKSFTRLVLDSLTHDRVTGIEASRFLELKYPHIEKLRLKLAMSSVT